MSRKVRPAAMYRIITLIFGAGPSRSGSSLFDGSSATSYDTQIDLDIPRTQPGHTLFVTRYGKGQRMLFEVLHELSGTCKSSS